MAERIWLGTTDDDFEIAANWSGAAVPVDNDDVIIPVSAPNHLKTNVNQSANDIDLDLLYVQEGSTVEIGASGAPLELVADKIIHRGAAPFHFNSACGAASGLITDHIEVQSRTVTGDAMVINSEDPGAGDAAVISRITLLRGKTTISGGTTQVLPRLEIGWVSSPSSDVICVIGAGGAAITSVLAAGGLVECNAVITALVAMGGQWTQDTEEIVTLHMSGRPLVIYNAPTAAGTMTLVNVMGGVLDTTRSSDLKTITDRYIWPGAVFLRDLDLLSGNPDHIIGSGYAGTQAPLPSFGGAGTPR